MRSKQQPRPSYHRWLKPEENEEGDDALESPEQKDVLTSGSASPSSTQSLEGAPATTSSTMLRDPESHHSTTPTSPQPPPHLIDSHDDVEHNIPATLIQDPSVERELSSPRCLSRDSSVGGRCPSDDSMYSGRGMTGSNATSPVAITLPATLPPAAAAALLPPQSAAMAAYLGVAAAAAQQNRLLFNSSLTAGLTRAGSPPLLSLGSHLDSDVSVLDFSTKRSAKSTDSRESDSDAVNLSNKSDNGPLDLSVNRKRNADSHSPQMPSRKQARPIDYKPVVSPWTSPVTPYFAAAVAAASISPKNHSAAAEWASAKGKMGSAPNDATKALEKMSELSRLGGEDIYKQHGGSLNRDANAVSSGGSSGGGGRHSAWQSHWLNKGADSAKDVLKCVWCKQSFPSLAAMTTHMKETKHCGVNVPPSGGMSQAQPHPPIPTSSSSSGSSSSTGKPSSSDLNLLIKETMPLPRKLVRGQDVWLGKGAEQTRQILKCMWCGQSFRSLAEMTSHMQQTQHYTNIISQEQIISWKSSEDGKGPAGPGNPNSSSANQNTGPNSTVSAVLTCKVCDQAFSSLKDLSNHMVKNAHYKEHIMRSITESGGRRRQTREKRKKSLPVRKLLELERAQHDFKNGETNMMSKTMREAASGRITCEKCGDKIDTVLFVEHIRQCVGGAINSHRVKPPSLSGANSILPPSESVSPLTPGSRDGRKSIGDEIPSPASRHISPNAADLSSPKESSQEKSSSSPSVLNAIEQLIEKSFDTRSRHSGSGIQGPNQNSAPLGSSILKRLGIDESVDYTKPLIDHQTMNLLRSYQQQQVYGRRERSGSESSSFSDRGSSRVDSLTPERKIDQPLQSSTPRLTPEKQEAEDLSETSVKIKREPEEEEKRDREEASSGTVTIKKEVDDVDDARPKSRTGDSEADADGGKIRSSSLSSPMPSPRHTPVTPAASPGSDRSTPRSQVNAGESKKAAAGGSLGALSSMFDSLAGGGSSNAAANEGGTGSGKKGTSHPLAALQKLCDKTETNQNSRTNSASSNSSLASNNPNVSTSATAPGAILAFSWACNDAVMTSDSIMKCAFCDTPFISKGAYRHHLSKMHFVKDDVIPDPITVKSQKQIPPTTSQSSPKSSPVSSGNGVAPSSSREGTSSTTTASASNSASVPTKSPPPGSGVSFEESPHSKFLKYTELAKQLSSKYV
ncbi:protein tiptop isoform X2 [Phlebotomus papatasi]|uniref:protein tiptop isoform X2 n=1 Tax=Phlebotomus papatasi TaxID=29031 RepID=UPI0024836A20|nr:protein tiptop isoform X2 [Phlebotomus papatasi]XP_055697602.1 protein tiptop isoform X2 [Phlebotomus papatasi]